MTPKEKMSIYSNCIMMKQETINAYFDSGIFNELVEAYIKEYLKNNGIQKSKEQIHEEMKNLFDLNNAEDILKK